MENLGGLVAAACMLWWLKKSVDLARQPRFNAKCARAMVVSTASWTIATAVLALSGPNGTPVLVVGALMIVLAVVSSTLAVLGLRELRRASIVAEPLGAE